MRAPFPPYHELVGLIRLAKQEDMRDDDVTSRLMIPADAIGRGVLLQKQQGVICGLPIVEMVCRQYDQRLSVTGPAGEAIQALEGQYAAEPGRLPRLIISGPMRPLLSAERVLLNFVQRLSGIATQTYRYVQAIAGTRARIYDTRKTTPGWRLLEKYAVRCGGGQNHRFGLYDGLLIKDNHLAAIPLPQLAMQLTRIVQTSRRESPGRFIQVEVDTLDQLREALKVDQVDSILLDNMDCPTMSQAVRMRDQAGRQGSLALEASGNVSLTTVRAIAETGVDRISVGALTHAAVSLDIGLDVE